MLLRGFGVGFLAHRSISDSPTAAKYGVFGAMVGLLMMEGLDGGRWVMESRLRFVDDSWRGTYEEAAGRQLSMAGFGEEKKVAGGWSDVNVSSICHRG